MSFGARAMVGMLFLLPAPRRDGTMERMADYSSPSAAQASPNPRAGGNLLWLVIVFLLASLVIDIFYLTPFLLIVNGGLLVAVAVIALAGSPRPQPAAKAEETTLQRIELKDVLDNVGDALIAYDKDFQVFFFNPSAERLFAVARDTVVGRKLSPQDAEDPSLRLLAQVVFPSLAPGMASRSPAGEFPQITDLSFSDPFLEFRVTTSPVRDAQGAVFGFVKVVRDHTHEASLIKSKNEFVTIASHQLRTPLTEIHWALESLNGAGGLNPQDRAVAEGALNAANELLRVIDDLLNIARIEDGRFGYAFAPMDIAGFLDKIVAETAPAARRADVSVYFERADKPLPPVVVDAQKLALVVANLLDNAVRYNVKNGQVAVRAEESHDGPFEIGRAHV